VFAVRFLMVRDAYQGAPCTNVLSLVHAEHIFSHPRAVWDFIGPWSDPEGIEPMMAYIDFHRAQEADYEVGAGGDTACSPTTGAGSTSTHGAG
jgi:hypothetical protein